ncbi:MAG: hypothetical protein KatS3mg077_1782 [Candidatus Binatia bacterium]|nr:MAG: hypothetical protein KatS3mg077_1782 [Candidatus Binatia bacterium]
MVLEVGRRAVRWSLCVAVAFVYSAGDVGAADAPEAGMGLAGGVLPAGTASGIYLVTDGDVTPRLKQLRKDVRQALRRFRRVVGHALRLWVTWLPGIVGGFVWVLVAGSWSRQIVERGLAGDLRGVGASMRRGAAVYVRLLRDKRTPGVGKALVVAALIYAAAPRDLIADSRGFLGIVEDAALLAIVSRSFLRMCKEEVVEAHARAVIRRERRRAQSGGYGTAVRADALTGDAGQNRANGN